MFLLTVSLVVLLVSKWAISVIFEAFMLSDWVISSVRAFLISSTVSIFVMIDVSADRGIFKAIPRLELKFAGERVGGGDPFFPGLIVDNIIFFMALIPSQQ